jgi:hypothetical protein
VVVVFRLRRRVLDPYARITGMPASSPHRTGGQRATPELVQPKP